jgi:hypothetical protein
MSTTDSTRPGARLEPHAADGLPPNTHVAYSRQAETLNRALLQGFHAHQHDADIRRTHLFNGRYENLYLTARQVPQLRDLLDEACEYAGRILGIDELQTGCWFNHMPPGAVTTLHSHDDLDELLSAVYYVSVPENSGSLIIHDHGARYEIEPEEGKFVFFAPDVAHEVSENKSARERLSIGINFGHRGDDSD